MAFGMKQWLAVMVLGFALVAAWRLPPEAVATRDLRVPSAEQIRFDALEHETRVTAGVLFRSYWADSLSARVVSEATDGVAVLMPPLGEAADLQRERLTERIRLQVDARTPDGMVFGYVIQSHDHRDEDGAYSPRDRTETYVGIRDGTEYCLQVRVADSDAIPMVAGKRIAGADDWATPYNDDLGPCRFYLSYGPAGPAIQAWMERGGIEFAFEPSLTADDIDQIADEVFLLQRRGPFGYGYLARKDIGGELDRCLAGIESACGAFVDAPDETTLITPLQVEIARRSPATGIGSIYNRLSWVQLQRSVLADLEAEFGAASFRDFWTSEAPVGAAFEDAFGTTPGAWMVRRIEGLQGIDRPGPGVPRRASSASMLTMAAFLGIAYWRRRERKVVD